MHLTTSTGSHLALRLGWKKKKTVRESNEALHGEQRDRERLSRVILNLCMFSEVICNRFTEDAYLPVYVF